MLAFIHINKTGGNTLSHILRSSYGMAHCQVEPWHDPWALTPFSAEDLQRVRRLYPRLKSIAGHRVYGHVDLAANGSDIHYITLMRDPLKRCASRFQFNVQARGKTDLVFEEWIQTDYPRNLATKWIAGGEDVDKAIRILQEKNIFVGLTERYDESLVLMKRLVASDLNISYERVNFATDNTIKDNLLANESTRQMLIEAQRADLELYDYVSKELYPAYQREFGSSLEAEVARYQQTRRKDFNNWNLTLCRLKHYLVYKPMLTLYRRTSRGLRPAATG